MEKVSAIKLNSAQVKYDNSVNTERVYDIEVNVNLQGENIVSFDSGVLKKDGVQMASFSKHGKNQMSVNFNNVSDSTEMYAILMAVNTFIEDVKAEVVEKPINI